MTAVFGTAGSSALCADEITVLDDGGQRVMISARWVAEGKGAVALERRDARWEVVPAERIVARVPQDVPAPLSAAEVEQRLREEFPAARLVSVTDEPFVLLLITARPVSADKKATRRWEQQLRKAGRFLKSIQVSFREFADDAGIEVADPKHSLVVLIFEDDREFDRYLTAQTAGAGLSAEKINSFYDLLTNRLVLRLRECRTFDTPLHEAVHQQAHNRGVLARLAPVPAWFNEGLATGFEGDGEKIKSGPKAFNRRYARIAVEGRQSPWSDLIREDKAFQGDILAGEAYAQAWGLHWWLLTRYRNNYRALLRHYASLEPLTEVSAEQRLEDFTRLVGKSPDDLQQEFRNEATRQLKRRTP